MQLFTSSKIYKVLAFLCMLSMLTLNVWAQDGVFPKPMNPPRLVNDFAKLLSPTELADLEQVVLDYNKTTSIEIAIVTVNSLQGYEVADYTIQLANQWKIGKADKDNGVLILVSKTDRKMFIASGYGMEGVLTDAKSGQIYRNEMTPAFRNNDYYQGLLNAVNAIVAVSKNEYTADEEVEEYNPEDEVIGMVFLIGFIILMIFIFAKGKGGGGNGTYMSRNGSDILTGAILGSILSDNSSSGSSWGGGDSGGFDGFGGGSFGGGGAGGSW